jgi:DNA-directed RNA polymerase sigma subunit (sigma70/sigma32)
MNPISERDAAMIARYVSGQSLRQVALDFSVSHERVRQILEREGVASRTRSDASRIRKAARA